MRLRRNIPTFIFGVSVGLLAGVGFFVFKINDLFTKIKDAARNQITVVQQPVKNVPVPAEEKSPPREKFKIHLGKRAHANYKEADSLISADKEEEISVATDELLSSRNVKVIHIADKGAVNDTLSPKLAEVVRPADPDPYLIEFWKTPLNSKGYRFTRNKIMLYGFVDFSDVQLYEVGNEYYIRCSGQVYRIRPSSDFKKMERVTNEDLLTRLS